MSTYRLYKGSDKQTNKTSEYRDGNELFFFILIIMKASDVVVRRKKYLYMKKGRTDTRSSRSAFHMNTEIMVSDSRISF